MTASGRVVAVDGFGLPVGGFPVDTPGVITVSPLVADLDADGLDDVVGVTGSGNVVVVSGDGSGRAGFPLDLGVTPQGAPALDDLDGDGTWELAIATTDRKLYVASLFPGGAATARAPWTRYRGHDGRTNRYAGEAPRP